MSVEPTSSWRRATVFFFFVVTLVSGIGFGFSLGRRYADKAIGFDLLGISRSEHGSASVTPIRSKILPSDMVSPPADVTGATVPLQKGSSLTDDMGTTATEPPQTVSLKTSLRKSEADCKMEPLAKYTIGKKAAAGPCFWTPVKNSAEKCEYTLQGACYFFRHKATGCSFFGWHRNEIRVPADLFLPGPAPGEIKLTEKEAATLRKPFEPCDSRPRYFLITGYPLGSTKNPLPMLAGGSPNMPQHIYFVEGEVSGETDSYLLSQQKARNMKIIVDLGANVGFFSISACKRFPNARILAFEPHPANFRFLTQNLAAAGCKNVQTFNKGLSKDGRSMKIYWHESIGTSAFRVGPNYVPMESISPEDLWRIVGPGEVVSFMKVDCEGCEYEVVPLLQQWRVKKIVCEVHGATVQTGASADDIKDTEKACHNHRPYNTSLAGRPPDVLVPNAGAAMAAETGSPPQSSRGENSIATQSECKLGPMAQISMGKLVKVGACFWQAVTPHAEQCEYRLEGGCKEYHHKATGCTFWGWYTNEQRKLPHLFLPGPAPGEIALTPEEAATLLKPFEPCDSRPQYWLITGWPLATEKNPIPMLVGGSPSMGQHVYFVLGEVQGAPDSYRLSIQKKEDMKVIVDLGANVGFFSISACKRFPEAQIFAFEPHPANFRFLTHNLAAFGCKNVKVFNKGLSKDGRSMKIYWHESIGTSAFRPGPNYVPMESLSPEELWDIVGPDVVVNFMKVDCEGCEYEVVPLLQQWRVQQIVCEVHGATVQTGARKQEIQDTESACARHRPYNTSMAGHPSQRR